MPLTSGKYLLSSRAMLALIFCVAVFVPRLTQLGTTLTNDEPIWESRASQFMKGIATLQPTLTFSGGQPGVTTMWVAGLANQFQRLAISQGAIALVSGFLLCVSTVLMIRMYGWPLGILAGFFLAFDNFLLAHSRVVHTDAFTALGMLLSFLLLAVYWHTRAVRYLRYGAMSAVFAFLSKITGGFMFLLVFAVAFLRPGTWSRAQSLLRILGFMVILTILIWPATWHPIHPLKVITSRAVLHSEETDAGKGGNNPWYYAQEWLFRLNPVSTIGGIIGLISLVTGTSFFLPRAHGRKTWLTLVGCTIVFGVLLSLGGQKGDRYFLLGSVTMDILAAVGIVWLGNISQRFFRIPSAIVILILGVLCVGYLSYDTWRIHPYELAHYNRLFSVPATKKLGWGEGLEHAITWIMAHEKNRNALSPLASYYASVANAWYPGHVESVGHEQDSMSYKYVVLYRSMFGRDLHSQETQYLHGYFTRGTCVHSIVINDLPYIWIFQRLPNEQAPDSRDDVKQTRELLPLPRCNSQEQIGSKKLSLW